MYNAIDYLYNVCFYSLPRSCFKKNSSLQIWPINFSTTFFRILLQNWTFYLSKILMTFFSHRPFLRFSSLPCLTDCPSFLFLNSTFLPQKFLYDLFLRFCNSYDLSFSHRPFLPF